MDPSVIILLCVGVPFSSSLGLPPVLDITQLESADPGCLADLTALRRGLDSGQLWAQTMVDAGVRAPVGLLSQTAIQFGDFDECLTVNSPVSAQYCLVDVSPIGRNLTEWEPFKWALCVPSSCSPQNIQEALQDYLNGKAAPVDVVVQPVACTTKDTAFRKMTVEDFLYCAVMVVVFLAVFIATVCDKRHYHDYDSVSPPDTLGQCLSARYGVYSLMRVDVPIPGINLGPLYGLHTCVVLLVVLGHRFMFHLIFMSVTNYRTVEKLFVGSWLSIWSGHMDLLVDILMFLSSYLLALFSCAALYASPMQLYFHRLRRFMPLYAVVIFFYATVFRQLGDGPLWNMFMDEEQKSCRDYWWTNLLFINTYVETDKFCILQSWVISCEFQFFVLGTLLMLLLKQKPRLGVVVMVIVFLLSTITPFLGTYLYDRPAMLITNKEFFLNIRHHGFFNSFYKKTHNRGTSYLMGLLTGCYVYKNRESSLTKSRTYLLQTLGIICCLVVNCSGYLFQDPSIHPGRLVNATYAAVFHTAFGIGMALLIISFSLGKPTFLSRACSWKGFIPLSRLSYSVFLIHSIPQFVWIASSRTAVYLNPLELISWTIADLVLSLAAALVLYLTVETPSRQLVKLLLTGTSLSTNQKNVDPQEGDLKLGSS